MTISKVKQLSKQVNTFYKGSDSVEDCYRKVILTNMKGNECYDVTLWGGDALIPLEVGQKVLVDLRCECNSIGGKEHYHYYVRSIHPLEKNVKIKYVEDWTTHLV